MRRFLLYVGDYGKERGGAKDFWGEYDDFTSVKRLGTALLKQRDWVHALDLSTHALAWAAHSEKLKDGTRNVIIEEIQEGH